jgi:adenylate cyclase
LRATERCYQRAIALNPNDANAIASIGGLLANLGRPEEGIDHIREAMRLNPYHPDWYWAQLGMALYTARRYADSAESLGHVTRPDYWILWVLAACLAQMGRMDEAATAAAEARQLRPDFSPAKLRLPQWKAADAQHIIEGMCKAELTD